MTCRELAFFGNKGFGEGLCKNCLKHPWEPWKRPLAVPQRFALPQQPKSSPSTVATAACADCNSSWYFSRRARFRNLAWDAHCLRSSGGKSLNSARAVENDLPLRIARHIYICTAERRNRLLRLLVDHKGLDMTLRLTRPGWMPCLATEALWLALNTCNTCLHARTEVRNGLCVRWSHCFMSANWHSSHVVHTTTPFSKCWTKSVAPITASTSSHLCWRRRPHDASRQHGATSRKLSAATP